MEYRLNHTFEHKSKFQKALSLWQEDDIIDQILSHYRDGTFSDTLTSDEFKVELFNGVINKSVTNSSLPHLLKADLCETIDSVGRQIFKYIDLLIEDFYESQEKIEAICIRNIFWTEDGTIDKSKSLKYLMENTEHINLENFYRLSCTYCIDENLIDELWWKLPEKIRNGKFYERNIYVYPYLHAVAYWKHYRDGTLSQLKEIFADSISGDETIEESLFLYSASYDVNEAAKFFYNKIPEDNQQQSLLRCVNMLEKTTLRDGELMLFLLSKMDEENRLHTINQFSNKILEQLLNSWPWRELYIPVFDNITYLTKDMFLTIVDDILESIKRAEKSYKLKIQLILSKIWNKNVSKKYKKCINFFQMFMVLLEAGDIENVVLISMDKELENMSLIHLAFLIIHKKYSHLLEKYEDLVNEKFKLSSFSDDSLKYCLSEFLKNEEYEAVIEILSCYFGSRQKTLESFKSNFPFNTVLKEVWKNESEISPAEHSEKMLECIFGKDRKRIASAKSRFSKECLFDVYSFLVNKDEVDRGEKIIAWLKISKTYENKLKKLVQK